MARMENVESDLLFLPIGFCDWLVSLLPVPRVKTNLHTLNHCLD